MLKIIYKSGLIFLIMIDAFTAGAQNQLSNNGPVNSAMRSNDKIYVVMAVCITILVGLIIYLIRIDKKVSALEKSNLL
ncbi:MAG: hypothetical protein NVS3B19_15460 [Ginsengibacter sp.]